MKELDFEEPDYNNLTGQEANPKETVIRVKRIKWGRELSDQTFYKPISFTDWGKNNEQFRTKHK